MLDCLILHEILWLIHFSSIQSFVIYGPFHLKTVKFPNLSQLFTILSREQSENGFSAINFHTIKSSNSNTIKISRGDANNTIKSSNLTPSMSVQKKTLPHNIFQFKLIKTEFLFHSVFIVIVFRLLELKHSKNNWNEGKRRVFSAIIFWEVRGDFD